MGWDSIVSIVTRLWAGEPAVDSWQGQRIFLFSKTSVLCLGQTQPPFRWVLGYLSQGSTGLGHETDLTSDAEVKNGISEFCK